MLRVLSCWALLLPIAGGQAFAPSDIIPQAESLARSGDKQGALEQLGKASDLKPQTAETEDKIGFLYAALGETTEGLKHFRAALALDPKYPTAHFHLGVAEWLGDDRKNGLSELEQAVALDGRSADFRYRLGSAYLDLGEDAKAEEQLKQAASMDSSNLMAWTTLGQAAQHAKDLGTAADAYAHAVELSPADDALRNLYAWMLIEIRQPQKAIAEAQKVLAHNASDVSAEMNIGYAHLKSGDFAQAEEAYRTVVKMDVSSPAGHYDLGIALKMQDKLDEAQKELEEALKLDPGIAEAHYTLGVLAWQAGDFAKMKEQMKAAIQVRPEYAEAHYMLGTALKDSGDLDGAIVELKEAIRLDPSTPGPFNTLGQILRQKGDIAGSKEAFATGARLNAEKNAQLANSLEQGMRGGMAPKPLPMTQSHD